ncbi:BZ3500_MvSof-1268-A1-R1_Chr1-1g01061 [Microbotryum saponariae]|uniref:BZ3500_MvSof-1268-A1-R1_Chr1-1g01061 protein n=1 Tax=Microbotryum saponariae TaxID=289078 RepID=A0A2X0MDJ2_9BASI|nr:BZ3500_MvSof-1268-A1-R1_Chr1-1g01061 [Microbotryum saponariae]SCZ93326.1 BZ3501_MvSof-1269-A2-R1_Chr1-1g00658 [Microbotryum saponariae]
MVYTIIVHLKAKDLDSAEKIARKLVDAATVYRKDKEQLIYAVSLMPCDRALWTSSQLFTEDGWFTGTDPKDPLKFAIVERFVNEASQKYHLENPYWLTFNPYVIPLLDGPMDLTRWEELPVPEPNQDSFEAGQKAR